MLSMQTSFSGRVGLAFTALLILCWGCTAQNPSGGEDSGSVHDSGVAWSDAPVPDFNSSAAHCEASTGTGLRLEEWVASADFVFEFTVESISPLREPAFLNETPGPTGPTILSEQECIDLPGTITQGLIINYVDGVVLTSADGIELPESGELVVGERVLADWLPSIRWGFDNSASWRPAGATGGISVGQRLISTGYSDRNLGSSVGSRGDGFLQRTQDGAVRTSGDPANSCGDPTTSKVPELPDGFNIAALKTAMAEINYEALRSTERVAARRAARDGDSATFTTAYFHSAMCTRTQ